MKKFQKWLEDKIHNQKIYVECCENDSEWEFVSIGQHELQILTEVHKKYMDELKNTPLTNE